MSTKEPFEIPVGIRRVCRRFERWRKGHTTRLPTAAADAVQHHLPARPHLQDLGAVPAQGRGEYSVIHRAGVGTEVAFTISSTIRRVRSRTA
jgi:hypothetical protein